MNLYTNVISHNFSLFYNIDMILNKDMLANDIIFLLDRTDNIYTMLILIDILQLKKNIETSLFISESMHGII